MDFDSLMDLIKGNQPGTTKAVKNLNQNATRLKAHHDYLKTGRVTPLKQIGSGSGLSNAQIRSARLNAGGLGLGHTVSTLIPQQVYDRVSNEILRGGLTVLGQDTSYIDSVIKGKPVIKSVGTTDFNIITPEGMRGYAKAIKEAKKAEKDTPETPEQSLDVTTPPLNPDLESGGVDTRTGTKYNSFQEQQQDLMGDIAKRYSDPRTAALIRGVPINPFASTQLPYTEDSLYTNFSTENQFPDFGIDPSKMLDRSKELDYTETVNNLPGYTGQLTFNDSFTGNYVSPVNYDQPQTVKDPMLLKGVSGMTAMRMKDRDLGLMYASGQFFAEDADGKPVLVNRDLAKSVRRGDEGAKDQLAAYLAGGGIKPQGGVITNPTMEQMTPPKQVKTESLVDPTFDRDDYEVMGGNPENFPLLTRGGGVQMDIDRNFDLENPNTSQIGPLQHPFSKVLAENPVNRPEKMQVVDTDKFGSVTSLINKYGIDDYLDRMNAGQFF